MINGSLSDQISTGRSPATVLRALHSLSRRGGQHLGQPLLPKIERLLQLLPDQPTGQGSKHAAGEPVLHRIRHQRTFHAVANLRGDSMPMAKLRKRPAHLLIHEVAVPFKLDDARHPAHPLRKPAYRTKADENLRALTGRHTEKASRRIARHWSRWRRLHA